MSVERSLVDPAERVGLSDPIISDEQLLRHAGLGRLEEQMVRAVCQNDLSDMTKLCGTLRDQFGQTHERENRGTSNGEQRMRSLPWTGQSGGITAAFNSEDTASRSAQGWRPCQERRGHCTQHLPSP